MFRKIQFSTTVKHAAWRAWLVGMVLSLGLFNNALAAAGDLDTTFSGDGKVTTNFPGSYSDWAYAVTIQPNGKIVAAGRRFDPAAPYTNTHNFALARYNSNGSLDTSFSADGR